MNEHAGAFDVAEEFVAEADALGGPFDESGQVGEHEPGVAAERDDTQVRVLRSERIRGDFRRGPREAAEQRGLPGIGESDEPGVGNHLQFEANPAFLAFDAGFELAGRAVGRTLEVNVPFAAATAFGNDEFVAEVDEVAEDVAAFAVADLGAGRDEQHDVLGIGAGAFRTHAGFAVLGAPVLLHGEAGEVVGVGVGANDDGAAIASIAAVGAALGHVLFAAEGDHASAAIPTLNEQFHAIDEHVSLEPILEGEAGHVGEVLDVTGDEHGHVCERDAGDEHVGAAHLAALLVRQHRSEVSCGFHVHADDGDVAHRLEIVIETALGDQQLLFVGRGEERSSSPTDNFEPRDDRNLRNIAVVESLESCDDPRVAFQQLTGDVGVE